MVRKRKTKSETRSRVCDDVDRISPLSDDLLVKILSFLPTRVAVSTSILSKRWECLWMWLPKLKFDFYTDSESEDYEYDPKILQRFLNLNLPLHRAPVQDINLYFLATFTSSRYDHNTTSPWRVGSVTSIERLMSSITSVKRLTLCLEFLYGDGLVFNHLEHLKLCVCTRGSSNLLTPLLEDSPNLRVLDIIQIDHYDTHWEESPTSVDASIESCLQAFDWSRYFERRPQEMDLAVYILGEIWSLKDCNNNLV